MEFDWTPPTWITSPGMASRSGKHERRRLCLGETSRGRLLTFVVTERKGRIRFVTALPMHSKQREIYRGQEA
jgi:uncharacterized DUF497 family protein